MCDDSSLSTLDSPVEGCSKPSQNAQASPENSGCYLIFTQGTKCCFPHQVAIKRIAPEEAAPLCSQQTLKPPCDELDRTFNVAMARGGVLPQPQVPHIPEDPFDFEPPEKFDVPDHLIEMNGHIIGMSLSPDHRFAFM
jgi:F-box/WD-40 domain protein 5